MLKIQKLHENAIIPFRSTPESAGLDLHCIEDKVLQPGERHLFKIGISASFPAGVVAEIQPRSKLANKYGIDTLAGVVDSDYRGEIGVILINHGTEPVEFKVGNRIAQMLLKPIFTSEPYAVKGLEPSKRGEEGINSTDLRL